MTATLHLHILHDFSLKSHHIHCFENEFCFRFESRVQVSSCGAVVRWCAVPAIRWQGQFTLNNFSKSFSILPRCCTKGSTSANLLAVVMKV